MCFGNDSPPPPPQLPPPPPPPEMMDIFDEIRGVQSVVVTGPDGKKRRVTSRMPQTPEEEQKSRMIGDLISSSMQNISQLYRYNPQSAVNYAPLIETFANLDRERMNSLARVADVGNIAEEVATFKQMQSELTDEHFSNLNRTNEAALIRSGVSNSSYAAESRASMARAHRLARLEGDAKASMYGEDIASKRLSRNKEAFGLEEMGRQGRMQTAQGKYALAKDYEADMERRRLQAIQEQKGMLDIGLGMQRNEKNDLVGNNAAAESLATFNSQAGDSMNRYNADINRRVNQYNMSMTDSKAQPPSFGEVASDVIGSGVSKMFTSNEKSAAGRLGKKFIG